MKITEADLQQYCDLKHEITQINVQLTQLNKWLNNPNLSTVPVSGLPDIPGNTPDPKAAIIAKKKQLEAMYLKHVDTELTLLRLLETAIAKLPATERTLMRLKYFDGLTWNQVADRMSFSRRHVLRLHQGILAKI